MKDLDWESIGLGVAGAIVALFLIVWGAERTIFKHYREQVRIIVRPVDIDIEASCPNCGHLWTVRAGGGERQRGI